MSDGYPSRSQFLSQGGRVTLTDHKDAQRLMELLSQTIYVTQKAARTMHKIGFVINTNEQKTAREECGQLAVLLLKVLDEFKRLHPLTCHEEDCLLQNPEAFAAKTEEYESRLMRLLRNLHDEEKQAAAMGYVEGPDIIAVDLEGVLNDDASLN